MSKKYNVLGINISQKEQNYSEMVGDPHSDERNIAERITISSYKLDKIPEQGMNFDKDETTKNKFLCLRSLGGEGEFDAILITKVDRS